MTEIAAVKPASKRQKSSAQVAAELKIADEIKHARRKSVIEFVALIALIASTIASVRAVDLANETSDQTIHAQSELSGNETWSSYRDLQADFNKELERDYKGYAFVYPSGNDQLDVKYEQLNERLLMAADIITFVNEVQQGWDDPQWEDTFAYEFRENSDFFLSDNFLKNSDNLMSEYCTYRRPARRWLIDAFDRSSNSNFRMRPSLSSNTVNVSSRRAEAMLRRAEQECERICATRKGCT